MYLLKILSRLKLPKLSSIYFNSVPPDSEEVRLFMSNSIPTLDVFYLNHNNITKLEASKYQNELKIALSKTTNHFGVDSTSFKSEEFWELVSLAKHLKELWFRVDIIPLDEQPHFGSMEGSILERLVFHWCGHSNLSNWKTYPMRFENLIAGIAQSEGLKKSINRLHISDCEITRDYAQTILNKYSLNSVTLEGI